MYKPDKPDPQAVALQSLIALAEESRDYAIRSLEVLHNSLPSHPTDAMVNHLAGGLALWMRCNSAIKKAEVMK